MSATTIDRVEDRLDVVKVLLPEVRRQTRRRRLWIGLVAATAVLIVIAVGISQASGASRNPAPLAARGGAATAAGDNCSDLVTGLDQGHNDQAFAAQASYASTAGDVAAWEEARDGTSPGSLFSSADPSELLTVCFITGPFGSHPGNTFTNGRGVNQGAAIFEILPSGYAIPDVLINGTNVPCSPPPTTSTVQQLTGPIY
jgi:hypothetical protein